MPGLAGGTAVVTGASRGIGRAIAKRLAGDGAEVALWARDAPAVREVAREIEAAGGRAQAMVCEVTDRAAVHAAAELVRRGMPPAQTIVNNAGNVLPKPTVG